MNKTFMVQNGVKSPLNYMLRSALVASFLQGGANYNRYKNGSLSKKDAVCDTLKFSAKTSIATGSAVSAINFLYKKDYVGVVASLAAGFGGVVAVEKLTKKEN